jgi:hypothetical protein
MIKIRNVLAVFIGVLMLATVCSATTYDVVAPHGTNVAPGGTIDYVITVSETGMDEYFNFFTEDMTPSWSPIFSPTSIFVPDQGSESTTLTFTIPKTAKPGTYAHRVYIGGYDDKDNAPDPSTLPDLDINDPTPYIDLSMQVVQTDVSVPEFPSVALPVAAILGLVVVFGRKKEIQ